MHTRLARPLAVGTMLAKVSGMATIQANPNPRHHQRQDVLEDPLDTKVRRRLIGTWTFLLVLATGGVLAWFFAIR